MLLILDSCYIFCFRRGALIVRRLCVLLDAERVYREFSIILEGEDLDFASVMVQVTILMASGYECFQSCNCRIF